MDGRGVMFIKEDHWRAWFAWFPVRTQSKQRAWLKRIERRLVLITVPEIGLAHKMHDYRLLPSGYTNRLRDETSERPAEAIDEAGNGRPAPHSTGDTSV